MIYAKSLPARALRSLQALKNMEEWQRRIGVFLRTMGHGGENCVHKVRMQHIGKMNIGSMLQRFAYGAGWNARPQHTTLWGPIGCLYITLGKNAGVRTCLKALVGEEIEVKW